MKFSDYRSALASLCCLALFIAPAHAITYKTLQNKYYPYAGKGVLGVYARGKSEVLVVTREFGCYFVRLSTLANPTEPLEIAAASAPCAAAATDGDGGGAMFAAGRTVYIAPNVENMSDAFNSASPGAPIASVSVSGVTILRFSIEKNSVVFADGTAKLILNPFPGWKPRAIDQWWDHAFKDIRFSSDGGTVIGLSTSGELANWDWQTERRTPTRIKPSGKVGAIATATTRPLLAAAIPGTGIEIYSTDEWQKIGTIKTDKKFTLLELNRDGAIIAAGDRADLAFYERVSGKLLGYSPVPLSGVSAFAFVPDTDIGVVGGDDGFLMAFKIPADLSKHPLEIRDIEVKAKAPSIPPPVSVVQSTRPVIAPPPLPPAVLPPAPGIPSKR